MQKIIILCIVKFLTLVVFKILHFDSRSVIELYINFPVAGFQSIKDFSIGTN